jgi:putative transport protein
VIDHLLELLHTQTLVVLFVVLGFGYLVGRVGWKGFTLGPVAGVLFAGLVFGHFGFEVNEAAQTFGFAMFIFCVGFQAGPRFVDVMVEDGLKYLSLALVVAVTGFVLAATLGRILELQPGATAGLLAGALTTTPTLAAAQDAIQSGLAPVPEGWTVDEVVTNIGTGYAITYLFGVVGLILLIRFLPAALGTDLAVEAAKLESSDATTGAGRNRRLVMRAYRVERVGPGSTFDSALGELDERHWDARLIKARRDGEFLTLDARTMIEPGDEIAVLGRNEFFVEQGRGIGAEIFDDELLSSPLVTAQVVVTKPELIGKPARDIRDWRRFNVIILGMRRMRVELPRSPDLVLKRGDVITFSGPEEEVEIIAGLVGNVEQDVVETDLFTFGLGIVVGLIIGSFAVTIGGVSLTLGAAGGLLISGLTVGFLRSIRPTFGRVPSSALWLLMELGLLMFMAGVGLNAGAGIIETLEEAGVQLILAGIVVTVIPVLVTYAFGRLVLRMNPALLMGGITGGMTSGACLNVVTAASRSTVPALGYTGAYAFANVILTLAGSLILLV